MSPSTLKDIERRDMNKTDDFKIMLNGRLFNEREKAGTMLKSLCQKAAKDKEEHIGSFRGFDLIMKRYSFFNRVDVILHGNNHYTVELGDSAHGNMIRIENVLNNLEHTMDKLEGRIDEYSRNMEQTKEEYEKPFEYEKELKTKLERQFELNALLDMDKDKGEIVFNENSMSDSNEQEIDNEEAEMEDEEMAV